MIKEEMMDHYKMVILPYWKNLIDRENGGYYGLVDFNLKVHKKAEKGVILNSRILWFFSNAFMATGEKVLLEYANHAYTFLVNNCIDKEYGGVYWMMNYDGTVKEDIKHTYNQAFAIYALSAYYEATKDQQAEELAMNLFHMIEDRCTDEYGYLEAFTKGWEIIDNDKLSENGLLADKTMNTLLHVLEAYTGLYKVTKNWEVEAKLKNIIEIFGTKVYHPEKRRLEVFFNKEMESIADLHSYGHDIEASWLLDEACKVLGNEEITIRTREYTDILAERIYTVAIENGTMNNECFHGVVDRTKVWWIQAEAVVGFYNAYEKTGRKEYLQLVMKLWDFIKTKFIDKRDGGEWFWDLNEEGEPVSHKPITEPWKCPYHNGRMCFEMNRRMQDVSREEK